MKTWSCKYLFALFALVFFLSSKSVFGQNCNQNNVTITGVEVRDMNGNPFTSADAYELGEQVNGRIYIILGGSNSGNAYSTVAFFDLLIGGVKVGDRNRVCISEQTNPPFGTLVYAMDVTWNWGEEIRLSNVLARWFTNTGNNRDCADITEAGSSAQCFSDPVGFVAELPVQPNLDFDAETCNPTVNFINQTFGGKPPYTYLWQFFDGATLLGTSTEINPTFTFPGIDTYNVSLSATDVDGVTNTLTKPITIPAIDIQIEVTPTRYNESTGSILVQPNGGTAPYTVEWRSTDPEGITGSVSGISTTYLIDNLPFGNYEVFVTDSQGCPGYVETFIDIATILMNRWGGLTVSISQNQEAVVLDWNTDSEGDPGLFYLERAEDITLDFYSIGSVASKGFSDDPLYYQFIDDDLPYSGGRTYYRIRYEVNNEVDIISEVVAIDLPQKAENQHFSTFPNPFTGDKLTLNIPNHRALANKELTLSLFSSNLFIQKEFTVQGPHIDLGTYVRSFPKGVIIVQIKGEGIHQSIKVLKK
ncbi:PKD domain-containing protein [Arthrospiribacter ruber]|uniref:PKD domain-containing protein n=1 Tax=Arthrospiribacter ruber TaxID=2487934 RepID=A0A951IY77_9BACT|nr:PKD domain-containing protein [Arthrospiribacter ruber]MBW3468016.1 PKD domain-containing protein [Arthrospiribacter ruber]